LTCEKSTILTIFVIPKSRDWDVAYPGIWDWQKRPGSGLQSLVAAAGRLLFLTVRLTDFIRVLAISDVRQL